jgi:hypothetical protein
VQYIQCRSKEVQEEEAVDVRKDGRMGWGGGSGWAIWDYGGGWTGTGTGTNCDSRANEAQRVLAQPSETSRAAYSTDRGLT